MQFRIYITAMISILYSGYLIQSPICNFLCFGCGKYESVLVFFIHFLFYVAVVAACRHHNKQLKRLSVSRFYCRATFTHIDRPCFYSQSACIWIYSGCSTVTHYLLQEPAKHTQQHYQKHYTPVSVQVRYRESSRYILVSVCLLHLNSPTLTQSL